MLVGIIAALWATVLFLPFDDSIQLLANDSPLQLGHQIYCVASIGLVFAGSSILLARYKLTHWAWSMPCLLVASSAFALPSFNSAGECWRFLLVVTPIGVGILAGLLIVEFDSEMRFWTIGLFLNLINLVVNLFNFSISKPDLFSADLGRFGGLIGHPAGLFLPSMVLSAVAFSKSKLSCKCKVEDVFTFFCNLLTMLMTGYRSAAIGLTMSVFSNLRGSVKLRACHWVMAVASIIVLISAFTLRNSSADRQASSERSSLSRVAAVGAGVSSFLSHPAVGVGPGQFTAQADYSHAGDVVGTISTKGGNLVAHLLAEWGILGAGSLFFAFGWIGLRLFKSPTERARFNKPILLGLIVVCLLDVPMFHFLHPGSTLLCAIWFSLAAEATRLNPVLLPYSPSEAKGEE